MTSDLYLPRNWDGVILLLSKMPDGSAELFAWNPRSRTWSPSDRGDRLLSSPLATAEDLVAAGLYDLADAARNS